MAFGKPVTFKLIGVEKTIRQLERIDEGVKKQVRLTLKIQLESWVLDAQMLTPVDTGALQASGRVLKPRGSGSAVFFQIIFGGVTRKGQFVDYADEIHTNHPTGAGFLKKVVDARSSQLESILASDLDKAIKKAAR